MEECKKVIGFFGANEAYGCFSNFYMCDFTIGNNQFTSVEQYFMYMKAMLMEDYPMADQILCTNEPANVKKLGRRIKNYDDNLWSSARYDIMVSGVRAKFTQNTDLGSKLLSTGDTILAECSPYDKIWGIGLRVSDRRVNNQELWKGKNLLGEALMKVRDELRSKSET